ncbi:hypothetical protein METBISCDRAFT_21898 [Metschnikowia bicuspidata]|uniref:BZIP domain-containing protein n=1 Tax=Metschnikowia bicuspidata TaxID=27322 RepID=A0A4P9ZI42_9ASCO|nr:hypothetical protein METBISCDRAFT_21898 [Metschnikowia bicuspidata]
MTNTVQPKTPLDLELNLFENSFAEKALDSLPHASDGDPSLALCAADANNVLAGQSASLSLLEKQSGLAPATTDASTGATGESMPPRSSSSGSSNKHNLRILNLPKQVANRLPGLTPPIFYPGERKLPQIYLLPGLSSPGSSNMWSSLLNATNGPDSLGQYGHPGPHLTGMLRKLGLVPTELNLRTGLTPGLTNHASFNFNLGIPSGNTSGQMTPGFLTLIGLANNASLVDNPMLDAHQSFPAQVPANAQHMHPNMGMPLQPADTPYVFSEPAHSAIKAVPEAVVAGQGAKLGATNTDPEQKIGAAENAPETTNMKRLSSSANEEDANTAKKARNDSTSKCKTAKASKTAKSASQDDEKDLAPNETEEEKKRKALERNRVAATKCRQRKKRLLNKMESELEYYSSGFRELSLQVSQLCDQLLSLHGIIACHKDCPTLLRAVGGYQQMQAILAQLEYIALILPNTEANVTSMPSTIPTTLNAVEPPMPQSQPIMGQGARMLPPGGVMHNIQRKPMTVHNADILQSMPSHGAMAPNQQINSDAKENVSLANMAMNKQYPNQYNNANYLKTCNSASDLQAVKINNHGGEMGLQLEASIADIPGQLPIKEENM